MGQQSRLKRMRREQRIQEMTGGQLRDLPIRILRSIHRDIRNITGESNRRCWEYLLEMMAHSSGWQTDSTESVHLWDKMPPNDDRWREFFEAWMAEVEWAKRNGTAFSEPLGQLLEELESTNTNLGQYFTPMEMVRLMNQINLDSAPPPTEEGLPTLRVLEPSCGTGRFMIDALVHHDGVMVNGVDTDIWMVRCAMMNVRLLAKWTSLRIKDHADLLKPLARRTKLLEELNRLRLFESLPVPQHEEEKGDALIIGGRAIFIHGDSMVVDLGYAPNWLCAGWAWGPRPWRSNLKIDGFDGTYDQWVAEGKPPLGQVPANEPVQFDFSMVDKQPRPPRPPP